MLLKKLAKGPTAGQAWMLFFGLWGLFLSGAFASFVGSPGLIQALRLKGLLNAKQAQVAKLREETQKLQAEATALERSRVVQLREIRRVLGYAAGDEIIFDFTVAGRL